MIRSLSIIAAICTGVMLYGQASEPCSDSLFVQPANDTRLYVQWRLGASWSPEAIASRSGMTLEALQAINPILIFRDPEPCDIILSEFDLENIDTVSSYNSTPIYYRVRQGETLFGIARRSLHMHESKLMQMNHLSEIALSPGQVLLIGWLRSQNTFSSPDQISQWSPDITMRRDSVNVPEVLTGHLTRQTGVAWWNKSKADPHLFVLHRTAPINSIIEIRNPMFDRKVYAKVIGTIPPTYTQDIAVIVSQGVAKSLGAIDGRFFVEMSYAVNE